MLNYWDKYRILKPEPDLMEENKNWGPELRKIHKNLGGDSVLDYNFSRDMCKRSLHVHPSGFVAPRAAFEVSKFDLASSFFSITKNSVKLSEKLLEK